MKKFFTFILLSSFLSIKAQAQNPDFDQFIIVHAWAKHTSGVLYFEYDLKNNSEKMCQDIKEEPWRLTMIDQEGSPVLRLHGKAEPPSYEKAKKMTIEQFEKAIDKSAQALKQKCLRVNLAPVVDTQMGIRSYAQNSDITHKYGLAFAQALRNNGIISTWKHFPGLAEVSTVYDNDNYKKWYKNINGEGVIENSDYDHIQTHIHSFAYNQPDIVMFSLAIYPALNPNPAIFNEDLIKQAHIEQPQSLLIPDDLSELNMTDESVVWLFKHFDLLMYTSPQDALRAKAILNNAYLQHQINTGDIEQKIKTQNDWRKKNQLPLLPQ